MSAIGDRAYRAKLLEKKQMAALLDGAIDMHYHGYPEITLQVKSRLEDVKLLELARDMGMRALVFKSQMWPTTGPVYHLRQRVADIECVASITLNSIAGGLNAMAVEVAAKQGAKVVWLPTWSSSHSSGTGGFSTMMKTWFPSIKQAPGIACLDDRGRLKPEVRQIIKLAKDMALVLCTGHVSPRESLAVAKESKRIGFNRLVFTHPLSGSVGATFDQIQKMAGLGAYIEICALNIFYGHELKRAVEIIEKIGAGRCVLSSDAFGEWVPPEPEFLRMLVTYLLISGIKEEDIRTMVCENPAILLDLNLPFKKPEN